jgi:catalase
MAFCLFAARFHEKLAKTRRKGTRVNWEALTVNQPRMHVKEVENRRGQVNLRRKN